MQVLENILNTKAEARGSGRYANIQNRHFAGDPAYLERFQCLAYLVPQTVNRVSHILDISSTEEAPMMNKLYQKGVHQLIEVCKQPKIEALEELEGYAESRLMAELMVEADLLLN